MPSKGNYQDDDCLVELLATDLDQHFKELVFIYESRLEVYAFDVIGQWQDAEDVVQDALLRVYLALKGYSAVRIRALKLRAWLYTIVRNACYNYMRRQKPPVLLSLSTSEEGDQSPEIEVDCSELPETVVEAMERIHEIEQAMQALPKFCREMVRLRLLEGFSYKEIAELLKRPLGTVKHHIHCGIAILAKNLRGQGGTK